MNTYDALYILDIQGKEEGVREMIDELSGIIQSVGGSVQGTRKMERRKFENVSGRLDAGYYLGVTFEIEPSKLAELREKLKLNDKVYRQFYTRVDHSKQTQQAEPANA